MNNILKSFLPLTIALATMGCNKSANSINKAGEVSIDSIEIHRVGGIAGFGDHFMVTRGFVKKDTVKIRTEAKYVFDFLLPGDKQKMAVHVLDNVPAAILTAANPPYPGDPFPDMMTEWIVVYKGGKSNTLSFFNFPESAQAYKITVDDALNNLVK